MFAQNAGISQTGITSPVLKTSISLPASKKHRIKTRRFVTNGVLVQAVWHRILECFEIVVLFYFLILENTDLVSQADSHKLCSYRDKYSCAPPEPEFLTAFIGHFSRLWILIRKCLLQISILHLNWNSCTTLVNFLGSMP